MHNLWRLFFLTINPYKISLKRLRVEDPGFFRVKWPLLVLYSLEKLPHRSCKECPNCSLCVNVYTYYVVSRQTWLCSNLYLTTILKLIQTILLSLFIYRPRKDVGAVVDFLGLDHDKNFCEILWIFLCRLGAELRDCSCSVTFSYRMLSTHSSVNSVVWEKFF